LVSSYWRQALRLGLLREGDQLPTVKDVVAGLGKQFGRLWALSDCTLSIPAGHVVGQARAAAKLAQQSGCRWAVNG
jgi:hypothetical protein